MRTLLVLPALVLATGCDQLLEAAGGIAGGERPRPPTADLTAVALVERPTDAKLAAWFCADLAAGDAVATTACELAFEPPPEKAELRFVFDTVFDLRNPNRFPVPLVEMLLALTVFEGDDAAELGAVCVTFCEPDAEDCAPPPGGGCRDPDKTVRDADDFVPTVEDLIRIATDLATGEAIPDELAFRYIPARSLKACRPAGVECEPGEVDGRPALCCDGACEALEAGCEAGRDEGGAWCAACAGRLEAHVHFELSIEPMLAVLEKVALRSGDQLLRGETPDFDIPYQAEGALFFDVPVLGRLALPFGPFGDTWSLD